MDPISFLGAGCPSGFRLRTLILQPHDALEYHPTEWADTLLIVERGELEIECRSGVRASFGEGALLAVTGLAVRCLRNAGSAPLVLSALSHSRAER
jgi:hypothetical protein